MMQTNFDVIISDIDGVIVNLMDSAMLEVMKHFGVVVPPSRFDEHWISDAVTECGNLMYNEVDDFLRKLWRSPSMLLSAHPYFDMLHALRAWNDLDRELHFTTRRADAYGLRHATAAWLFMHGFPETVSDHVAMVSSGITSRAKEVARVEKLTEAKSVLVLEDNREELPALMKDAPKSRHVVLVARPWNRKRLKSDPKGIVRMPEQLIARAILGGC